MIGSGRQEIWTDAPEITQDNIIQILRNAMATFTANKSDCDFLIRYEQGFQPLKREKKYRPEIDVNCVDNVANEVTEFKLSFNWGFPITLVQRGEEDSGKAKEHEGIALLNECYEILGNKSKTQKLARFVEITGIGYTFVDINSSYKDGDSPFNVEALDPRYTFVVRSSYYIDHRVMLGVTYRCDDSGNRYFSCFTKDTRYEIVNLTKVVNGRKRKDKGDGNWNHADRSGEANPLGVVPVIEWIRAHDRMGCFERQIPEMDNLNILISDFTNDVEQNTQAVWHANDIDLREDNEEEATTKPQDGDWLFTYTAADGKTPFVKPLTVDYAYDGMLKNMLARRGLILQKCGVPQRNDNSGGSTGVAMDAATGWSAAEASAAKEQCIIESCKMEEVKAVLRAIACSTNVKMDSPLLDLKAKDIQPNIKRQKTYEMVTKTNAFSQMISHGVYGLHALKTINLFEDPAQVWSDSKEMINAFQESVCKKAEEVSDMPVEDETNQIQNSPFIDGMSKESPAGDDGSSAESQKNG